MRDDESTDTEERDFLALYSELNDLLARFGVEDAFANGDYWLNDDYYGKGQNIYISRIEFLINECVDSVQHLLAARYPEWSVAFVLELEGTGKMGTLPGLLVFWDRVEERWDRDLLARTYGDRFKWRT